MSTCHLCYQETLLNMQIAVNAGALAEFDNLGNMEKPPIREAIEARENQVLMNDTQSLGQRA